MNKQWLTHFTDADLSVAGFVIFFIFFVGMLVWVFRKTSHPLYSYIEKQPLDDGDQL